VQAPTAPPRLRFPAIRALAESLATVPREARSIRSRVSATTGLAPANPQGNRARIAKAYERTVPSLAARMNIRTSTIARLRDALLQSGRRPSVVLSPAYETLAREGLLTSEEATALQRVDPLAEIMFLMMSVDGNVADEEIVALRGAVRGLSDDLIRSGTLKVMVETYQRRLEQEGRDARLQEIAEDLSVEPSEAEGAFALAAAIALADDEVAPAENDFINQLADWLGIAPERADEILDQLDRDKATP
jgi:tellurite resistance protein